MRRIKLILRVWSSAIFQTALFFVSVGIALPGWTQEVSIVQMPQYYGDEIIVSYPGEMVWYNHDNSSFTQSEDDAHRNQQPRFWMVIETPQWFSSETAPDMSGWYPRANRKYKRPFGVDKRSIEWTPG